MSRVVLKRGDTRTAIRATLLDAGGSPVDLSGATVRFLMATLRRETVLDRQAAIEDAAQGAVSVTFEPGDTDAAGTYWAEFEATFADGRVETYPNSGYITVEIQEDLG